MKILVIGGSKFIGLNLVSKLLERKHDVTVFNNDNSTDLLPVLVRHITGDRRDHKKVQGFFKDEYFDIVFDTCGFESTDIEIFIDVLKNKIKQYIFCSSVSVYDFNKIRCFPVKENFPLKAAPESDNFEVKYGSNKVLCEKALLSNSYLPVTIFRPVYVYGPYAYDYRVDFFLDRINDGRTILIPPIGHNVIHFIHVADLAEMFTASIGNEMAYNKIYNAAPEETTTMFNFIKLCGDVIGKEVEIKVFQPEKMPDLLSEEELNAVMPKKIYPISLYFDGSKVRQDLSWEPRFDLVKGLKNTYAWYMQHRKRMPDYSIDDKVLNKL